MRRTIAIVVALCSRRCRCRRAAAARESTTGSGTGTGAVAEGGILRIGTINYVDSFNPFNYIESQSFNAFIMLYPQLVQYDYQDGEYIDRGRPGRVLGHLERRQGPGRSTSSRAGSGRTDSR